MRQGTVISGSAHLIFVVAAFFGMPDFREESELTPTQVTDVSIVSLSDFQAARSSAPDAPETPDVALNAPVDQPNEAVTPEVGSDDTAPLGIDTPLPDAPAQDGSINSNNLALLAPEAPNLAPRIDTSAAPKPPKPAPEAPVETPAVTPEEVPLAEPVEVPEEAAAPKEATTEVTPDAVEQESPTTPKAAARPKGRPANLVADAERRKKEAEEIAAALAAAAAAAEPEVEPVEEAAPVEETAAVEAPADTGSRLGQDFNSSEAQAIGDVIGKSWNKTLMNRFGRARPTVISKWLMRLHGERCCGPSRSLCRRASSVMEIFWKFALIRGGRRFRWSEERGRLI